MAVNPDEMEYLAGDEMIEIIPRFECAAIWLVAGDMGPFKPGITVRVPLWIALELRKQSKCKLVAPQWMNKGSLEGIKEKEVKYPLFCKMPSENYMAVAKMIYDVCPQDIQDAEEVKILIKEIWDCRLAKLRTAIKTFIDKGASWAKVDNLTQTEMCSIRPFFPQCLEQLYRFRKIIQVAQMSGQGKKSSEI